jgi:hypothetical protein
MVMAFADATAIVAVLQVPQPVVSIMGGVHLTESEQVVRDVTCTVLLLGILTAPVWGIGGLIAFFTGRPSWHVPVGAAEGGPSRGTWALAVGSILVWLPILPWTQSEQLLRWQVERDLHAGRIAEGLELMSRHDQSDFPPGWDPPPRVGYGERNPPLDEVMRVLRGGDYAPWVWAVYTEKVQR